MSSIFGDSPIAQLTTEAVRLDLQKVGATISQSAEVTIHLEEGLHRRLVHKLEAYVLTEKLVNDHYVKEYDIPASWWQHFKLTYHGEWWLRWLVNRRPVRLRHEMVLVRFERYATYPRANVALPTDRLGAPVLFERVTEL